MRDLQKHFAIVLFFSMALNNILFLLSPSLCFCSKNTKKLDSLYFMCSLLVVTLLILHAFLLFSFLSYHVSLLVFALVMFIDTLSLSLSLSLSLLCFFCLILFKQSPLFVFRFFFKKKKILFSFVHRFL